MSTPREELRHARALVRAQVDGALGNNYREALIAAETAIDKALLYAPTQRRPLTEQELRATGIDPATGGQLAGWKRGRGSL